MKTFLLNCPLIFLNVSERPQTLACWAILLYLNCLLGRNPKIPWNYIDKELKWGAQVSNVCKKISYYLYILSIHRKSLTFEVLKMLTESLILSRIDYALPVWGPPLNKSQVARLQRLQNRGIRITRCLRKYDHVTLHHCQLNWLPISHQIMFKSSCAVYHHYHYDKKPCLLLEPLQPTMTHLWLLDIFWIMSHKSEVLWFNTAVSDTY